LINREITYDVVMKRHLRPVPPFGRAEGQCSRNFPALRRPYGWL